MSSCFAAPRRRWPRTPHAVALSFIQSGQAGLREGKQVVALSGSGCWEVAHWLSAPFCAVTNRSKVCRDNVPGAGSLSSLWRPPNSRLGVGCLAPGPSVPLLLPLPRVCWAVAVTWQIAFCRSPFYQSDPIWILRLTLKAKESWGSLMLKFNTIHPGYWRGQAPRQAILTSTDPGENKGFTVGVSFALHFVLSLWQNLWKPENFQLFLQNLYTFVPRGSPEDCIKNEMKFHNSRYYIANFYRVLYRCITWTWSHMVFWFLDNSLEIKHLVHSTCAILIFFY